MNFNLHAFQELCTRWFFLVSIASSLGHGKHSVGADGGRHKENNIFILYSVHCLEDIFEEYLVNRLLLSHLNAKMFCVNIGKESNLCKSILLHQSNK